MITIKQSTLEQEINQFKDCLRVDQFRMSFGELMSMYSSDELIIDPIFQKSLRWKVKQQTEFIESLLLGIPTPSILVTTNEEGQWVIIDGVQRISTVLSFFGILRNSDQKNNWAMEEGDKVKSLKGLTLKDLPLKFQLNIRRSVCLTQIIEWDSDYDMRYELFDRFNSGSLPATHQEIENRIFQGISTDLTETLKTLAEQEDFCNLIQPTPKQQENLYLYELVLRFFSLFNNHQNISNRLSDHMTQYLKNASNEEDNYVSKIEIFKKSIDLLTKVGSQSFKAQNNQFSSSLYDGILQGVATNLDYYKSRDLLELVERINTLKNDQVFRSFSGNSKKQTKGRISRALEVFAVHE